MERASDYDAGLRPVKNEGRKEDWVERVSDWNVVLIWLICGI